LNDFSGPMTILPLRRLFIERQIQPEMLSFVQTEEVVALFDMCVSYRQPYVMLFCINLGFSSYFGHLNVRSTRTRTSASSDVPLDAL